MGGMAHRSSKRPWAAEHPELDLERARGGSRREEAADGVWTVRSISASAALKGYVCPGCRQEIPPGTAHLVAWSQDAWGGPEAGLDDRRHWHRGCWDARGRRR